MKLLINTLSALLLLSISVNAQTNFTIYNNTCVDMQITVAFNNGSDCSPIVTNNYIYGFSTFESYGWPAAMNNIISINAVELILLPASSPATWYESGCGTNNSGVIDDNCASSGTFEIIEVSANIFEINEVEP